MRYIAIFLLLANVGYFAWLRYDDTPLPAPISSTPRPLLNSGLTLVSEFQEELALRPALSCFTIGQFNAIDDASSFIAELGQIVFQADISLQGEPLSSQYRVFLPPASSRGIATITLDSVSESISAAELEIETYLITRGTLENGIALGVFGEQQTAELTQNRVIELGFAAEIEEIPRSTGEILVRLQVLQDDVSENPAWLDLAVDRPDLTIAENLCETIAQGTQFP